VLESSLTKDGPAAQESARYGDGVKDLALTVFDAEKAWKQAIKNGGESASSIRRDHRFSFIANFH
jgi:4-hydroxyphenylpyruvate dioxygenase-like putative hemolysin